MNKEKRERDFPGSPVVKTLSFYCRGHRFWSLIGELRSCMPHGTAKKKKNEESKIKLGLLLAGQIQQFQAFSKTGT